MKEIKDDLSKWKDIACSLRLEDLILRCSNIQSNPQIQHNLHQNPNSIFLGEIEKNHPKIHLEPQGASNNFEKDQIWQTHTSRFQNTLQSHSNKNSMLLL